MEAVFQQPLSDDAWATLWAQSTFHTMLYSAVIWQCGLGQICTVDVWCYNGSVKEEGAHATTLGPGARVVIDSHQAYKWKMSRKKALFSKFGCLFFFFFVFLFCQSLFNSFTMAKYSEWGICSKGSADLKWWWWIFNHVCITVHQCHQPMSCWQECLIKVTQVLVCRHSVIRWIYSIT